MYKQIPIKNHHQEIKLITRRAIFIGAVMCVMLLALIARLAYLQVVKHEVYSTLSTKNSVDLIPVEPTRGLIYDRNGILLVENIPVYSLDIIPDQIENLDETIAQLSSLITINPEDILQFKKQVKQHRRFDQIPLKLKLNDTEVAKFSENQYRFNGVLIKARLLRNYLFGETFSHVIGYVGRINEEELEDLDTANYSASHYIGKIGVEKSYEDQLHGKVGYQEAETDASGRTVRILNEIKATPGGNIYLTLDSGLQIEAKRALSGHRGAIVAIQPSTGQILAMVSEPGFNPNLFVQGISREEYQALHESKDLPLFDRTIRGLYPPASTVKPFIAIQGLETGAATPKASMFDPGWFRVSETSHLFRDWKRHGHGYVNISTAIIQSCDTFFYDLAYKLGIDDLHDILAQFGFGKPTGIDLVNELGGTNPSPETKRSMKDHGWYDGDTILTGIGQGLTQVTPLQLASAVSTMANRGVRYQPHVLLGQTALNNTYTPYTPAPISIIHLENEQNWNLVIEAMQNVINSRSGTGYKYGNTHTYTIAAKTGTAQLVSKSSRRDDEADNQNDLPEHLRDHHYFIAFAPVDQPALAIAVVTENYNFASNIARELFNYYLGTKQNVTQTTESDAEKPVAETQ